METRDIMGKEVLATGTFHGHGSAPEGDTYTVEDLDRIVEAANTLSLKRPFKLGHNEEQRLIAQDGWPAVGWVENLRRAGNKLLADIKGVPAKIADLIDVGAYRTLSPELIWNYQDADGTTYDRVFTGLALLGADIPAITSLDDFVALYVEGRAYGTEGDVRTYELQYATKTEDGKEFPASDFAYTPDLDKPSTWKLRLTSTPGADPDPTIVGAAVAALGKGFRGKKVEIPEDDRPGVIRKVAAAWKKANPDKDEKDMPEVLKALEAEFGDGNQTQSPDNHTHALGTPNVGEWIESRMHNVLTDYGDDLFGRAVISREERIALSSAVGDALEGFVAALQALAPELYERPYSDSAEVAYEEDITDDPDILSRFAALRDEMEALIHGKTGAPRLRVWVREAHRDLSTILEKAAAKKVVDAEQVASGAVKVHEQGVDPMKKDVCMVLGLPDDTPDEDVLAKVRELTTKETVDLKAYVALDSPEYKTMEAELETLRTEHAELAIMKRDAVLNPALEAGKFTAADLEKWQHRYEKDPDETRAILEEMAPVVLMGEAGLGAGAREKKDFSDRKVLDEEVKAYRAEHPEVSYEVALGIVQAQ